MYKLMRQAKDIRGIQETLEALETITECCECCQRILNQPDLFRVALLSKEVFLNRTVLNNMYVIVNYTRPEHVF